MKERMWDQWEGLLVLKRKKGRRRSRARRRARERGMTLVEIMVVVVIISLVMSVVGVAVFGQLQKAQIETARTQIGNIGEALDLYRLSHKTYPGSGDLQALTQSKNNQPPTMNSIPKDPWDNDFVYVYPGTRNPNRFDIFSYGPDGQPGGGDDVGNWTEQTQ